MYSSEHEYLSQKRQGHSNDRHIVVDFGYQWKLIPAYPLTNFRVSWDKTSKALYAVSHHPVNVIIELGEFDEEKVNEIMDGWANPNSSLWHDLRFLTERIEHDYGS